MPSTCAAQPNVFANVTVEVAGSCLKRLSRTGSLPCPWSCTIFACSAAGVLTIAVLRDEPWFVGARPIEVLEQGVELEVVVRWLESEVWKKVPCSVDGYVVNVVLEGQRSEIHTVH